MFEASDYVRRGVVLCHAQVYSSLEIEILKKSQNSTPAKFLPYTVVDCHI